MHSSGDHPVDLKAPFKKLPYPIFLRLFLLWHWLRDVSACRRARRKLGVRRLREVDLSSFKKSDTLFLLGSGASINQITPERWAAIARYDTIGFNFWPVHRFVPRMYVFEALGETSRGVFELYRKVSAERAQDYTPILKVATELSNLAPSYAPAYPEAWRDSLFTVYTLPAAARNEQEFAYAIAYLRRKGLFRPSTRIRYLFKQLSTLSSLIALAARLQYRTIVLCGIDLSNAQYFYQDAELYPEAAHLQMWSPAAPHPSLWRTPWRIPMDKVVLELKRQVLDPAGIGIFVENRSSALWPAIPEAPSELFQEKRQALASEGKP